MLSRTSRVRVQLVHGYPVAHRRRDRAGSARDCVPLILGVGRRPAFAPNHRRGAEGDDFSLGNHPGSVEQDVVAETAGIRGSPGVEVDR